MTDWSKAVFIATEKRGVDVVVDNVGTTFPFSLRALRKGGRRLTVGGIAAHLALKLITVLFSQRPSDYRLHHEHTCRLSRSHEFGVSLVNSSPLLTEPTHGRCCCGTETTVAWREFWQDHITTLGI